jgi:hypothetical protein
MEITGCLIIGLALSFYYCWQITLVSLGIFPLMAISAVIQRKFIAGFS